MLNSWEDLLAEQKQQDYFKAALNRVAEDRAKGIEVFPPDTQIFDAFALTPPAKLKVVILGQDPYHGKDQAHGLCFSVQKGNKIPPSLRNIYKELSDDINGFVIPEHGDLTAWATQGILLLNTVLTVQQGNANSHRKIGWEQFTDSVITTISTQLCDVIFVLWGAPAQKKLKLIDSTKHFVLTAPHPSPLSAHRGFLGCKHFSQINQRLVALGHEPIDWTIS